MLGTGAQLFAGGSLGQSGANFLQIAAEPRGAALGGAITAIVDGADALYWNPAGALNTNKFAISFAHTNWFLDTRLTYGGAVWKINDNNAIGLSVSSFSMDEMEITTVYDPRGTGEYYNAGDLSAGISYARRIMSQFSFGITAKYIQEYIWDESANQLGIDLGSIYYTNFMNLRLGMAVRNFGGTLKHSGDNVDARLAEEEARDEADNPRLERLTPEFRLPQVFQMGVAMDVLQTELGVLTLMADVDVPSDNNERLILAGEYAFQDMIFARASYGANYDVSSFAIGLGVKLKGIRIDYSFSDHGVFNSVHRFGIKIQ